MTETPIFDEALRAAVKQVVKAFSIKPIECNHNESVTPF